MGTDEDVGGIIFRDLILNLLVAFLASVAILIAHIAESKSSAKTEGAPPPGNVMIEARWPDDADADVDLWVQAPGDRPVGYSNKGGAIFNLLRDDLGTRGDATGLNYEISYARGMPAGEYTVNLHLYRNVTGVPVPVKVVASVKNPDGTSTKQILFKEVELTREGQELTIFRFRLDQNGELVSGSVTDLQKPLRDYKP